MYLYGCGSIVLALLLFVVVESYLVHVCAIAFYFILCFVHEFFDGVNSEI